jgi:hypothetical protein
MKDPFPELGERSFIRSMTMISFPVTARWDWKFSKMRQTWPLSSPALAAAD